MAASRLLRAGAALGLGVLSTVAAAQAVANPYDYSRSSSFTYRADGLLATETVEPDRPDQCVQTTHRYDARGNRLGTEVAPCANASDRARFAPRSTASVFGAQAVVVQGVTVNVPAGTFATGSTNAAGHSETRIVDPRFGTVIALTGPNGLSTTQTLDAFGRVMREQRADGTRTETEHCLLAGRGLDTSANTSGCGGTVALSGLAGEIPALAIGYVQVRTKDSAGNAIGPVARAYKDRAGRVLRELTEVPLNHAAQPTDRRWVVKDTEYTATGVAVVKTQPYFLGADSSQVTGSADYGLEVTTVDALGRVVQVDVADPAAGTPPETLQGRTRVWARSTMRFEALTTVTTNPAGQARTEEKNVDGRVVRVTDAYGGQLAHQHDAFGNLIRTQDALQNLVTLSYDVRGRKLSLSDPDTGRWAYDYNALGELVWQQSPNQRAAGSATTMAYDTLGRMTQRSEPEYVSTWYHDKDAAGIACGKSVGKLCESVTSHGVTKKQHYDALDRPDWSRTLVRNGPSFESWLGYDATTGRLARQTYPTRMAVDYVYTSAGALRQVRLANAGGVNPLPATPGGTPAASQSWSAGALVLWEAGSINAWGQSVNARLGNGVQVRAGHDAATGRVLALSAGPGSASTALDHQCGWDALGNLIGRTDLIGDGLTGAVTERFEHDALNRLTRYSVSAPAVPNLQQTVTLAYNAIGNLLRKSDVGNYTYPAYGNDAGTTRPRPHGVTRVAGDSAFGTVDYAYDANGNVVSASGGKWRSIAYTSFNLPDSQQGAAGPAGTPRYTWQYDESHQRVRETRVSAAGTRTTWYVHPDNQGGLAFETETGADGRLSRRHYVSVGGQTVVLISNGTLPTLGTPTAAPPAPPKIVMLKVEYWLKDHLGSVTTTLDHLGTVTARYAYDPFGKRRQANGSYDAFGTLVIDWTNTVNHGTDRGFTGHEHLDDLGLVHMNGRIYDPTIGRFLQGDPFVQAPDELQNYNRYSYCHNNGLNCSDPSGYFFKWLVSKILRVGYELGPLKWVGVSFQDYKIIASVAASFLLPGSEGILAGYGITGAVSQAAIAGFTSGAIASGGEFEAAVKGAFTAAVFAGVGDLILGRGAFAGTGGVSNDFAKVALHGVAGCVTSIAGGHKCGPGALSAAFSKAATIGGFKFDGYAGAISSAVIGGTVSVLGGGKFANGAVTAAAGYLFNHALHGDNDSARMGRAAYTTWNAYIEFYSQGTFISDWWFDGNGNFFWGRPDTIDPVGRQLWELKSDGCLADSSCRLGAEKQLGRYVVNGDGYRSGDALSVGLASGSITQYSADGKYRFDFTYRGDGLVGYTGFQMPQPRSVPYPNPFPLPGLFPKRRPPYGG